MWGEKRPTSLGRLSLEPATIAVSRYKPIGFGSSVFHAPRLVHKPGKIKEMRARSSQGRLTSKRRLGR